MRGRVRLRPGYRGGILPDIEAHPTVTDHAPVQRTAEEAIVQVETTRPVLLSASKRAGVPVAYPIEIAGGEATVDVVGTQERISALGAELRGVGVEFEVAYLQHHHGVSQLLTDRQEELLLVAIEEGYYEYPRECTLTELAGKLDMAKSSCSGILRRAENTLVEYFVTNHLSAPVEGSRRVPSRELWIE